jgi:hypothetical protein
MKGLAHSRMLNTYPGNTKEMICNILYRAQSRINCWQYSSTILFVLFFLPGLLFYYSVLLFSKNKENLKGEAAQQDLAKPMPSPTLTASRHVTQLSSIVSRLSLSRSFLPLPHTLQSRTTRAGRGPSLTHRPLPHSSAQARASLAYFPLLTAPYRPSWPASLACTSSTTNGRLRRS